MSADVQPGLGWTGRVMQLLNAVWTLVLVNLLFLAGVLAGLVVLGVMPAATAAVSVLRHGGEVHIERDGGVVRAFVLTYRAEFRRANLTGLPFLAAALLLTADALVLPHLVGPAAAALAALTTIVALVTLLAVTVVITLLARYDDPPRALLRYAVAVPLSFPLTALGGLVVLASFGVIAMIFPVVIPLIGASLPLAISARLIEHRLAKLDLPRPLTSLHPAAEA